MTLTEQIIPDDSIVLNSDGSLEIREATFIVRDGVIDRSFATKYNRYVLHPGDSLDGKSARIVALVNAAWTPEVVAAYRAAQAQAAGETPEGGADV